MATTITTATPSHSPPWTYIWPIIKIPPPSTTTTPNSTTMNPQKKSIPKSNQTNSKFQIHKMTHKKKKNQIKIYTNPATNRSRRCKPEIPRNRCCIPRRSDFPVSPPRRTHDPRQKSPLWERDVMRERSPPWERDVMREKSRCGERETRWEREAVVVWWESRWGERGMKRETKGERESQKRGE